MAHSAAIASLTEELIAVHLGVDRNRSTAELRQIKTNRDIALKTLKSHPYGRVNQFDIAAKLDGLDEKFHVLDNEPLADALKARLKKLDKIDHRWKPEILSLLLHLSDRPVDKSRIEDLHLLKPSELLPALTWEDIIADDPLTEEGIWDEPDYGDDSSQGSYSQLGEENVGFGDETPPSTLAEEELSPSTERLLLEADHSGLHEVQRARFWQQTSSQGSTIDELFFQGKFIKTTELQAIRECILMLHGVPTHLFKSETHDGSVQLASHYTINHISSVTLQNILAKFAVIGSALNKLRNYIRKSFSIPLLQTFQYVVERRLHELDHMLSQTEQCFLTMSSAVEVSLQSLLVKVESSAANLFDLSDVVTLVPSESRGPHYACLELLFTKTCDSQMMGDAEKFVFFAEIFFRCLETYLKNISRWMEHGDLAADDRTFFVQVANDQCELSAIWHDRYVLRKLLGVSAHAPNFVQSNAQRIFNAGKSMAFLKAIGAHEVEAEQYSQVKLDFDEIHAGSSQSGFAPFIERFAISFNRWVDGRHRLAAQTLYRHLDQNCGLWQTLNALEWIYLSRNGAVFHNFSTALFERLDKGRHSWNDRFILTDLAQSTFGSQVDVDPLQLTAGSKPKNRDRSGYRGKSSHNINTIILDYAYPWPIMNIIRPSTIPAYQQVFTQLLRIARARYLLHSIRPIPDIPRSSQAELTYSLRHRLLWFVNIFSVYITEVVIWPLTTDMRSKLAIAEDIDASIEIHQSYIAHLAAQCLLTKDLAPIHEAITSIFDLCDALTDAHKIEAERLASSQSRGSFGSLLDHYTGEGRATNKASYRRKGSFENSDDDDDFEADGEDESALEAKKPKVPAEPTSYTDQLRQMLQQFNEHHRFVTAGLRGVGRAGGEMSWNILAEKLDWA
ncbi:MAG: hypothetical protein M1820_001657 [Bogoriella megaspora]|nr:MAG: hypothetical protein M1820_001657 [Bogoriella megaspora]